MVDELRITGKEYKKLKHGLFYESVRRRGYYFNTWLILAGFLIPLLFLGFVGFREGWGQKWYISCPEDSDSPCLNPFYKLCDSQITPCAQPSLRDKVCAEDPFLCDRRYINPGDSAGTKPSSFYDRFPLGFFCFVLAGYMLNHALYNSKEQRGRRRKEYENTKEP